MKVFKSCVLLILFVCFCIPTNVMASNVKYNNLTLNSTSKEFINIFPQFKESLKKHTSGVMISNQEVYLKIQPKENAKIKDTYPNKSSLEKDFYITEHTKSEYLTENNKPHRVKRSISDQEGPSCSWLKLSLQVYEGNGSSDFMVYNFCSWLTRPFFKFTDAIGISVSDDLIISGDKSSRHGVYEYTSLGAKHKQLEIEINQTGSGILGKFDLEAPTSRLEQTAPYDNIMIQTGVSFNKTYAKSGRIYGHYVHKEVGFGGIGMDATGNPTVSVSASYDKHSQSVYVTR